MCFDHDAVPPELPAELQLPRLAGAAPGERLTLRSADGTDFSAFISAPEEDAGGVGVVILPDVRGLYGFYEQLCDRFAQAGHPAIAMDYFGRTAGLGPRESDWDFWPEVSATTPEQIRADAAAAATALTERVGARPVVVVGFCFGGTQADLVATTEEVPGVAGVVAFYGALSGERFGIPSPKDAIVHAKVPVLALFGGADEAIPEDQRAVYAQNLAASGVEHDIVVYPGAPHSFFDRKQEEFAEASADGWRRTLAFLAARA